MKSAHHAQRRKPATCWVHGRRNKPPARSKSAITPQLWPGPHWAVLCCTLLLSTPLAVASVHAEPSPLAEDDPTRGSETPIITALNREVNVAQLQAWIDRHASSLLEHDSTTQAKLLQHSVTNEYSKMMRRTLAAEKRFKTDENFRSKSDALLVQSLYTHLLQATQATEQDADKFYQEHHNEFHQQDAIHLWRIQFSSEAPAQQFLKQLKGSKQPVALWGKTAAQKSGDRATHLRNGDLGFVRSNGHTDVPQVRVNRALFSAAQQVNDGEYVPRPVQERDRWAVLWRRGARSARSTPFSKVASQLKHHLRSEQARQELDNLRISLREAHLTNFRPDLLESVIYPQNAGVQSRHAPRKPYPPSRGPTPRKTDRGDR